MSDHAEIQADPLRALQAENARLIALLESRGIPWRQQPAPAHPADEAEPSRLSTEGKIALFRRLFRGRTDVYPVRWESKTTGKSGYSPACANEWRPGVCEKPRIKCGDCGNRLLIPLSDKIIYDHLTGEHTVGIYPLAGRGHLSLAGGRFRRLGMAGGCACIYAVVRRTRRSYGAGDLPIR